MEGPGAGAGVGVSRGTEAERDAVPGEDVNVCIGQCAHIHVVSEHAHL